MTITFKENTDNIKDQVLWLLMESYRERIKQDKQTDIPAGESSKVG